MRMQVLVRHVAVRCAEELFDQFNQFRVLMRLAEYLTLILTVPVSYTHLDVYKRQDYG